MSPTSSQATKSRQWPGRKARKKQTEHKKKRKKKQVTKQPLLRETVKTNKKKNYKMYNKINSWVVQFFFFFLWLRNNPSAAARSRFSEDVVPVQSCPGGCQQWWTHTYKHTPKQPFTHTHGWLQSVVMVC